MAFVLKSVNHTDHLGPDLIELRERSGLTFKEISHHTKLTESFICALENENWCEIGDSVYAERMLRLYVRCLGGKEKYFIEKYWKSMKQAQLTRKGDECIPRATKLRMWDLAVGSRLLALAGFFIFVLLLGGYVYREARAISAPPPMQLETPLEGARLEQPSVEVKGKTIPESMVSVNGREAVVQPDGIFRLTLDVPRGTTKIVISARKHHGEEAIETRHVVYDRPLPTFNSATSSAVSVQY